MASSQSATGSEQPPPTPDEEDDEPVLQQQPSARERAERAAAAAQARARGHQQQAGSQAEEAGASIAAISAVTPPAEVSTAPIAQPSQETTASVADTIASSTGVRVDEATAALAAATLTTNPDIGNDLAKSLAEQLECCECSPRCYSGFLLQILNSLITQQFVAKRYISRSRVSSLLPAHSAAKGVLSIEYLHDAGLLQWLTF